MLGLIVISFLGLYLVASVMVTLGFARWARRHNRRVWLWGCMGMLLMYNVIFWDLVPTLFIHKYYCANKAGFTAYLIPEKWAENNSKTVGNIKNYEKSIVSQKSNGTWYQINNRLRLEVRQEEIAHGIGETERLLRDVATGEVLMKENHFSLGWGAASVVSGGSLEGIRRALVFGLFKSGTNKCGLPVDPEKEFRKMEISYRSLGERE